MLVRVVCNAWKTSSEPWKHKAKTVCPQIATATPRVWVMTKFKVEVSK